MNLSMANMKEEKIFYGVVGNWNFIYHIDYCLLLNS